ncbi:Pleiotropic regulatory protein [Rhodospirillaceae bacterium LM-1]|nr:Pleiotropic regulatory protein [Rhodospirillaceae bacterium LM-1]
MEPVPFLDLRAQYRTIQADVERAAIEALRSTQFILGDRVKNFEQNFAAYCHTKHCVAVNSGTSALHMALAAADIGPGDEVITVSATFVATTAAILYAGAKPVYVDIDPATWTIDPDKIAAAVTARTRAILPVHLHGLMADMDPILEIASKHGLLVIEDAAQAHGAEYRGQRAGSLGQMGCFSFYPGKNLGACGEGGAIATNDSSLARRLSMLRDWGQERKYNHVLRGFNYRMDGVQGAILDIKLARLEGWTEMRRACAHRYDAAFAELGLRRPLPPAHCRHVYHVYALRLDNRDESARQLAESGISTGIHYPVPVHLQKAYADLGWRKGSLPETEKLAAETLSLPMFAELTEAQQDRVIAAIENLTA